MKSIKKVHLLLVGLFTFLSGHPGLAAPTLTFNQRVIQIREVLQDLQTPPTDKTLINFFQNNQFPVEKNSKDWNNWANWDNFGNWLNWYNWGNY